MIESAPSVFCPKPCFIFEKKFPFTFRVPEFGIYPVTGLANETNRGQGHSWVLREDFASLKKMVGH